MKYEKGSEHLLERLFDVRGDLIFGTLLIPIALAVQDFAHAWVEAYASRSELPLGVFWALVKVTCLAWLLLSAIVWSSSLLLNAWHSRTEQWIAFLRVFTFSVLVILGGSLANNSANNSNENIMNNEQVATNIFLAALLPLLFRVSGVPVLQRKSGFTALAVTFIVVIIFAFPFLRRAS